MSLYLFPTCQDEEVDYLDFLNYNCKFIFRSLLIPTSLIFFFSPLSECNWGAINSSYRVSTNARYSSVSEYLGCYLILFVLPFFRFPFYIKNSLWISRERYYMQVEWRTYLLWMLVNLWNCFTIQVWT